MTYCLGVLVNEGLLMMADTRTNAGIDNVSSYKKLHCLADASDRQIHLATSGSLSASQTLIGRLREGEGQGGGLAAARSMFGVAEIVGEGLRRANKALLEALGPDCGSRGASLLLGGRIGAERPRLFQIYAEGNFIECMPEMPFLQIGETKYGRPILNRVLTSGTPISSAIKMGLLSFDSAIRSNLSVALPIDMMVIPACPSASSTARRIEKDDPYFDELSRRWSAMLAWAADEMPEPWFAAEHAAPPSLSLVADNRG